MELDAAGGFRGIQRNWGYDGVLWYAPDSAIMDSPDDLKALIDEAHRARTDGVSRRDL